MRTKGMIKIHALSAAVADLKGVDDSILAGFPASGFPMEFPSAEGMYSFGPVMLTGDVPSETYTLHDLDLGSGPMASIFADMWDATWLPELVVDLIAWANGSRTELVNLDVPSVGPMFHPFGSSEAGYNRHKWKAGSVDLEAAESFRDERISLLDGILANTSGRTILGIEFPAFEFTTTELMTLEDSFEYPVRTWTAGDPTEWQVKALAVQSAMVEIAERWVQFGINRAFDNAFRIWGHGSQTEGRGE